MNVFDTPTLKIVLIRPGTTDLDEQGRITGALDVPLSCSGVEQVQSAAAELREMPIDMIYCGSAAASTATAQQLSRDGQIKVRVEEQLRNLDHGLWHGMLIEELKENQPRLFRKWQEQPATVCPPEGETIEGVKNRVAKVLKKILKKHKSGCIVMVVPEPLASITRSELESRELEDIWQVDGNFGNWDIVTCKVKTAA